MKNVQSRKRLTLYTETIRGLAEIPPERLARVGGGRNSGGNSGPTCSQTDPCVPPLSNDYC